MTDSATSRIGVACAVLHTDGEGNIVPCPGYPHAEPDPQPDEFGLHHCPRCTDAVRNLEEHLTWCKEPETDPLADARQLLADHQAAQAAACQAEIQAILDRYGMRLEISTPQIAIVPNP
jgi:hypothetical protein